MRDDRNNRDDMEEKNLFSPEPHATILPLLDAFSTGELAETEQSMMKQHIASCEECQRFLADIHTFRRLLQPSTSHPVMMGENSLPAANNTSLADTVMAELVHPMPSNERQFETTATKGTNMHPTATTSDDDNSLNAAARAVHVVSSETEIPSQSIATRRKRSGSERQHLSRFWYLVNMAAAILIVGVIIGASLLLFTHRTSAPTTGGQPTQTIPAADFCHLDVDPGLHYVCQNHLYQKVYQSEQMGKYTVTIQQAYADASRIAFSYTVTEGKKDLTMDAELYPVSITINHSIHGDFLRGNSSLVNGGTAAAMSFDPTATLQQKILAIQVNIGGLSFYGSSNHVNSAVTFSYTLPFHAEKRTIVLHQSTTANDIRMTLEGAVLSLSDAKFTLSFHRLTSSKVFPGPVTLSSGTTTCFGIVPTSNPKITVQQANVPCPIFTAHGQWTLTIHAIGAGSSNGNNLPPSWIFHFTIPSA